jgi:hypothetical protein
MKEKFNWSIFELENIMVWERDIYIDMILNSKQENE